MEHDVLLEMKNISKEFPGVKALDNVSLTVRRGTVHALMGENGAVLLPRYHSHHNPDPDNPHPDQPVHLFLFA